MQSDSVLPAALGITTTDRYPKVRSISASKNAWKIVGIAKGAGMIEPNMAVINVVAYFIISELTLCVCVCVCVYVCACRPCSAIL